MPDSDRMTYTEALGEVRENLATLLERSENTNARLDAIERKINRICDGREEDQRTVNAIDQRLTRVEANQGIMAGLLAAMPILGNAVAAWFGARS